MKTISVNISGPVYGNFKKQPQQADRIKSIHPRTSLTLLQPLNLGKTIKPLSNRADLLGEMVQ
jgi:hypothetical protein